jgi:hypothetical protein
MASVRLVSSWTEPSLFFVPNQEDMRVGGVDGDPVRWRFDWCVSAAYCVLPTGASLFGLVVGAAAVVLVVGADTGGEGRAANSRPNN